MKKVSAAGILILISISPLFRGLYFSCETYAFLAALALFSVTYLLGKIKNRESLCLNRLFVLPGLFLVAAVAAGFAVAVNPRENLGGLLLYTELLLIFIVLFDFYHAKKQNFMQAIMATSLLTGFVCAVAGAMAMTGRFNILDVTIFGRRVGSTFQYANTASIYFAICAMFALTLANASKSIFVKAAAAGTGGVVLMAFFLTGSRGGYITGMTFILLLLIIQPIGKRLAATAVFICMAAPALAAMQGFYASAAARDNTGAAKRLAAVFILAAATCMLFAGIDEALQGKRRRAIIKGSGLIYAAAIILVSIAAMSALMSGDGLKGLLPPVLAGRFERLMRFGLYDNSVLFRLNYNRDALKLISGNWLLGLGGGGWKAMYQGVQDFFYTAVFVHNQYLQVFVDNGIIGFAAYLLLVLISGADALRLRLKSRDATTATYAAGLLCCYFALAVHSSFDFDLSYVSLTLLFWVMFAATATRGDAAMAGSTGIMALVVAGSLLFSAHAIYFAGAYNRQIAFGYMQNKDYASAAAYYQEARRLDPANSEYAFELAKLYHYFARKSGVAETRSAWLEKAREAGECSVDGNKNYPAYINTLARIYLDSGMPLRALECARKLAICQKYNGENYELLARCLIAAAEYFEKEGNPKRAIGLLEECIGIGGNPFLLRSHIEKPLDVCSKEILSGYRHSEKLGEYLKRAESMSKSMLEKYF